jgi:DNA-binding MarR family transcriptional regulator
MEDLDAQAAVLFSENPDLCRAIAKLVAERADSGMGLTARQSELLQFLTKSKAQNGSMPSYREMADAMGLDSKSSINRLIIGLEQRGAIRRLPNRARAIEIVRAVA